MSTFPSQPAKSFFSAVTYPTAATYPPVSLQPYATNPVVVPASGTFAVATTEANITTYPSDDDKTEYTHASYGEDPTPHIFRLSPNNPDSWTLSLSISTPTKLSKPVLRSITYTIKYATTHDDGNSTVQADIVLTTATCPIGILSQSTDLGAYRNGPGYGPRMVDNTKALCLSSAPAIKCNGGTVQWSHYIDHRRLAPNVKVLDTAKMYLNFHVFEYPTAETRRYLAIEVLATWCDISEVPDDSSDDETTGEVEESGVDEAATLDAATMEAAALEAAKKEKEVAPPEEEEIAPPKEEEAAPPPISVPPPTVRVPPPIVSAPPPTIRAAPKVADQAMQNLIKAKIKELNLEPCPGGFKYNKTSTGYVCDSGGHSVTFAQLGMKA